MRETSQSRRRAWLTCLAGSACLAPLAAAQGSKPIRLIVPFTPGGSTDILARAIAPKLALALGRTVLIDNKPGAGGSLGATEAAKAEPDGSTLLMGHIGTLAVNPAMYPRLGYDPVKSFAPVAWVARVPNVLVVNAESPARNLAEFVALAKANPGRLTYSSGGNGSAAHMTFEYFKLRTKVFMLHIPYRGSAPSITDLIGRQVDATFTGAPALLPHIKSGRLRALAVSSLTRLPSLPEVPTVAESGYPGFASEAWFALMGPAGLPAPVRDKIESALEHAMAQPELLRKLREVGLNPQWTSGKLLMTRTERELPEMKAIATKAEIHAD